MEPQPEMEPQPKTNQKYESRLTFTIGEALDAMAKGAGVAGTTEKYVEYDEDGRVLMACVVGQGAIVLGISPTSFEEVLETVMVARGDGGEDILIDLLTNANDTTDKTFADIANGVKAKLPEETLAISGSAWKQSFIISPDATVGNT